MTAFELLIEQVRATSDENGWCVAVSNSLQGLTAARAAATVSGLEHSIWDIVVHLNFYNERHLRRVRGQDEGASPGEISETFASPSEATDQAWQSEVARFARIMKEWRGVLEEAAASASATSAVPEWVAVVAHIALHNAYHGGQIVLTRKLQGSWDTAVGVS